MRLLAAALVWVSASAAAERPVAAAYDALLKQYVLDNGTVRYADLKAGIEPLSRFVDQIGAVSPDSNPELFPTPEHKLAYWINTYNALVLWAFAKDYPDKKDRLQGVVGKAVFFYRTKFPVGGRRRSLDDIETNSIRKAGDPRIHFAIVCASAGCPWLAREAFVAERLDRQLEARAKLFLNQERNIRLDVKNRRATLSKIFEWFRKDFGPDQPAVLRFIAKYRPAESEALRQPGWTVRYFSYDWTLNAATGN